MTREPIYAALFAFFSALTVGGSAAFRTATRVPKLWEDVAAEDQPALLMEQSTEDAEYVRGMLTVWRGRVMLYVYVHTGAMTAPEGIIPAQILNPLLDAIEAALAPDNFVGPDPVCTLGGLVSHAAIEGTIRVFNGDLGDQAVALVPITFLVSP